MQNTQVIRIRYPETVDKKITFLRAIYDAAKGRIMLPENPFSNIQIAKERNKAPRPVPVNSKDLVKIFSAPSFQERKRPIGGAGETLVWLPLLSLFTGACLEELGQLQAADVGCEHGIHFLHITDLTDDEDDVVDEDELDKRLNYPQSPSPAQDTVTISPPRLYITLAARPGVVRIEADQVRLE